MLDFASLYLSVFCGSLALPPAFLGARFIYRRIEPHIRVVVAYFIYPKLTFRHQRLQVSGLGLSVLIIYIVANALFLGLSSKGEADLQKRAAAIAAMNLMLVFLGGKTNPLADLVRFPLSSYYLAHRCIAVIATAEVLLHSGLVLYRRPVFDEFAKSGTVVSLFPAKQLLCVSLLTAVTGRWRAFGHHFRVPMASSIPWKVFWAVASARRSGCVRRTRLAYRPTGDLPRWNSSLCGLWLTGLDPPLQACPHVPFQPYPSDCRDTVG